MTIIGVTGHRPDRINTPDWVRSTLSGVFRELGSTMILQGMADGVDLWAAAAAWRLGVPFTAVRPWRGHDQSHVADAYQWALRNAHETMVIDPALNYPGPGIYHRRNQWIVDHCDVLVAVWDGKRTGGTWQTMKYAQGQQRALVTLNPVKQVVTGMPPPVDDTPTLL